MVLHIVLLLNAGNAVAALGQVAIECRQCEKIIGRKRLPKGVRKIWKERLSGLAPVAPLLRFFPKKHASGKRLSDWSGKSIRERAEAVGLDLEYDDLHHILCGYKHTSPGAAHGLIFEHAEGLDVIVGPNISSVFDAAAQSASLMLRLIDIFQEAFQLAMDADVSLQDED